MTKIGVGVIGYGLGGRAFHAPYVAAAADMDLRAIVSRDPAKVHADRPAVRVVPDVATLVASGDVDLVVVSSPDALHADHAIAALDAGKHVLIDKPFATTLADARRIVRACRPGRVLSAFQNRRWDADFLTLRRLIAEDRLGEIVHCASHFDRWRPEPATTWKEEREGGSWMDLGPHLIDQALQLFGRPVAVDADIATLRIGAPAPDYFHATLHYPGRRVVLQSNKVAADHRLRFAVHGRLGSWIKHGIDPQEAATVAGREPGDGDWGLDDTPGLLTLGDGVPTPVPNERGDYRRFWTALAAAIRGNGPNPVPADDALLVMEVLDAGLRSASQQRRIAL